MEEVKKAYAWQEAVELAKELVRICEEFSDADKNVLVWHLRNSVVDIPSSIATDLTLERSATMEPLIKLATELELVRKIYPAIETGSADEKLEQLEGRLRSESFTEREPEPESEDTTADDSSEQTAFPHGVDNIVGSHQGEANSEPEPSKTVTSVKIDHQG